MPKNNYLSLQLTSFVQAKSTQPKVSFHHQAMKTVAPAQMDPLPALDYSQDEMSYELVDAINQRYAPQESDIVSRQVFGK